MVLKDDFKKAIQTGNLDEALMLAMSQAMELNITTWVAPESGDGSSTAQPGNRLRARIDLVQGKIENEVGDRFIGYGPYRELRDYHQQQVARSHTLIRDNLQSLQKLFGALSAIQQHDRHLAAREAGLPPLELSPLPPLVSSQPNSPPPSSSVIPTLEPLDPLPALETPSPTPETAETEPTSLPAPVMPVSELEIEDWEEAVGVPSSPTPPPASEELAPEPLAREQSELEGAAPQEPEDHWGGFRVISGEEPPAELVESSELADAIAPEPSPEKQWNQSLEDPSQSRVEEVFFEKDDWGEPLEQSPPAAVEPLNAGDDEEELTRKDWENSIPKRDSNSAPVERPASGILETPSEDDRDWEDFDPGASLGSMLTEPLEEDTSDAMLLDDEEDGGELTDIALPEPISASPETSLDEVEFDQENWEDFSSEGSPNPTPTESIEPEETETFLEEDENWSNFEPAEYLDSPLTESIASETPDLLLEDEDWGKLTEGNSPRLIETDSESSLNDAEFDEDDWDEFIAEDFSNSEQVEVPSSQSAESFSEEDEDGNDLTAEGTPNLELADLEESEIQDIFSEEDEDWGDFVAEEAPELEPLELEGQGAEPFLEEDEDWDELITEEAPESDPLELEVQSAEPFLEEDEDWDELIIEESPESASLELEGQGAEPFLEEDEDWGELITEESSESEPLELEAQGTETFSEEEEDWGDFSDEDLYNASENNLISQESERQNSSADPRATQASEEVANSVTIESSNLFLETELADEDWGEFTEDELDSDPSVPDLRTVHPIAESELDDREDWGEFTEEELEADPSVPDLRAHFREVNQVNETFDEDEEWEGLAEGTFNPESEVFREEPNAAPAIPNLSAMPGDSDAEWEEFEALDPFTSPIDSESSLDNIELEEDWDDFSAEELEPYPKTSDSTSDRELGMLEDASTPSAISSRVSNDAIATSPPPREDNPETFDVEGLEFEEVDLGERASEETFPSDEELFGEITAARPQVPPDSPENSSENSSRSQ